MAEDSAEYADAECKQRLLERERHVNYFMDQLPWQYKEDYLRYMMDEDRLPVKMQWTLVEKELRGQRE